MARRAIVFKEGKNTNFDAILISRKQHLQSFAFISKTEPKTLKTPLQEHQKELKTQPFGRSHVGDLAILQSRSCNLDLAILQS